MTLLSSLLFLLSSFSSWLRMTRHHRRARFRGRERRVDFACRWLFVVAEPLLPLITCCLLGTGFSAVVAVERQELPRQSRLDQNGTLVNSSSSIQRSFLLYRWPPSPAFSVDHSAAASSSLSAADSPSSSSPGSTCQLLTTEKVDQLCADFITRRLDSLSSPKAARRLQFCDMFDYRKLLGFANSLTNSSADCSMLLLTGDGRPNKAECVLCLTALVERDSLARLGAEEHISVLDKVQCNSWRTAPSTSSSSALSSILPFLTTSSPFGVSPSTSSSASSSPTESAPKSKGAEVLTEEPMTPQTHAGSSDCSECKVVYKGWLCTGMFAEVRPFAANEQLPWVQRNFSVPPCDNWCAAVETECPYFTPDEEQQNGGEPLFLCKEAHYHDSPRYPVSTSACNKGSPHRHGCCYAPDDLNCVATNTTCESLLRTCFRPRPSQNASDPSQQQQQYSGGSEANVTTNMTLTSSAGRTGDYGALSRLLLLLLVAYCCSELT